MNFIKTLNEKITTMPKTQFFSVITLSVVLLLICCNSFAQRNTSTIDLNGITIFNADDSNGFGISDGTDLNTFPTTTFPTTGTPTTGKVEVEITDVTLENEDPDGDPATSDYQYRVWSNFAVDFADIDLADVEKFSFYISDPNDNDFWTLSIADAINDCATYTIQNNILFNSIFYDLVEVTIPPAEELDPSCFEKTTGVAQVVVESSASGDATTASSITADCFDYHKVYPGFVEIINAEVLMRSTQNTISLAGDTFEQDFYVPTCLQPVLSRDSDYEVNLMLNNFTSTSIDVDVYIRCSNPEAPFWAGRIDFSFNNSDLSNPVLAEVENITPTLGITNNVASLSLFIVEPLQAQQQIFIGKLRFNYLHSPDSDPTTTQTIASSTFSVLGSSGLSYLNESGAWQSCTIASLDTESMLYEHTSTSDTFPEEEEEELTPLRINNANEYNNDLQISPNPTANKLNISILDEIETADLIVFDISGRIKHREVINENIITLNAITYDSGLYFVSILTPTKQYKTKFLVKR